MVGHGLYEVREVSVNLNEGDWHVDQICKMVNQEGMREGQSWSLGYFKTNVIIFLSSLDSQKKTTESQMLCY